jgi:antitoxin Phd
MEYRLNLSYFLDILKKQEVNIMLINTEQMISMSEANQNFSKVARMVDQEGQAIILKNNVPRYLVIEFSQAEQEQTASDEDVREISRRLIARNRAAYEELAK